MEPNTNSAHIAEFLKDIQRHPRRIFDMIGLDVKHDVGQYLSELMDAELTHYLGRKRYVHGKKTKNYRNGYYKRNFKVEGIGKIEVLVPRDRNGDFKPRIIEQMKGYRHELGEDLSLLFLAGITIESLSIISYSLLGRKVTPVTLLTSKEVNKATQMLINAVEKWRNWNPIDQHIKEVFLDGFNLHLQTAWGSEKIEILAAFGITEEGQKLMIDSRIGDKGSFSAWRNFLKDLKQKKLRAHDSLLIVAEGLPDLERVLKEEFPIAKIREHQLTLVQDTDGKVTDRGREHDRHPYRMLRAVLRTAKRSMNPFFKTGEDRKRLEGKSH